MLKFGVHIALTAESIAPHTLGTLLEEHGFESLFMPEHTHIPVGGRSRHPDGGLPSPSLANFFDPFVALAAVAAGTNTLRLGTGVCLITQHDPLVLAKVIATLDVISNGRAVIGIGAGWNHEEMLNHGTSPATRWRVMRDRVLALRVLWSADRAEYHSQYVDFDPVWQWPKPIQQPHPPVLIGGEGPRVLDRVLEYGDGWAPNAEPGVAERIAELRQRAHACGRPDVTVTVMHVPADINSIARYDRAGAERCVFSLPTSSTEVVRSTIEELAECVTRYRAAG